MERCRGIGAMAGVAIGPLHFYQRPARRYDMTLCKDPEAELARMEHARKQEIAYQSVLYQKALDQGGPEVAAVFDVHAMMLDDNEFVESVRENIMAHHMRAEYAVRCAAYAMVDRFSSVNDEYMRARIEDILDMARGLIYLLQGGAEEAVWENPAIVVADELSPSEAVRLDKSRVLGLVTRMGSSISHASILARSMELPAMVRTHNIEPEWEGRTAILDGITGELLVDPDPETMVRYRHIQQELMHRKKLLHRLKGCPNRTLDGHVVQVMASVSKPEDLQSVKENDADGIGQFRSDYLFVGQPTAPDEEAQYRAYCQLIRTAHPGPVYINTIDWGTTDPNQYLNISRDETIVMSQRGVRRSLMEPELFRVQLRALLRAAAQGNLHMMLPMVTNTREVVRVKEMLAECKKELLQEGKAVGDLKLGLQIETPAAVWVADELAQMVDFFIVGSNDLTQYTCVIARDDMDVVPYADPYHPAVMRAIDTIIKAGHRHGIPVGMCGEMGADTELTEHLLRMGIDSFSVPPAMVLPLRNRIQHLDLREPASPLPVWRENKG